MDEQKVKALERILETLIGAGDGAAFMAVAQRIEANGERKIRVSIEPPLDDKDAMTFDASVQPMRFRRPFKHGKLDLPLAEEETVSEQTAPMEYEHDGRLWRLWYRKGDILYLRRETDLGDSKGTVIETHAVDIWLESQKKFPNIALINAADTAPVAGENDA